jgi:hypothetical protein
MRMALWKRKQNRFVLARLVRPKLALLAERLGIDLDTLEAMTGRLGIQCAICFEPYAVPHIYFWLSPEDVLIPRGVICGQCKLAVGRYMNDYNRLAERSRRFSKKRTDGRERMRQLIHLNTTPGMFDPRGEYVPGTPVLRTDDTELLGRAYRNRVL